MDEKIEIFVVTWIWGFGIGMAVGAFLVLGIYVWG